MIRMEQVVKTYGGGTQSMDALQNISLTIKKGEFVAITGPSGCGKTTLLNIIGGMDRQTTGEYFFNDMEVNRLGAKELAEFRNKYIGFVFQSFHLAKELNVIDNVALPLGYAGVSGKKRRECAKQLLDRVGLSNKYKSRVTQLSGGEMQRVAIARALANSPQLVVADEPTGSLDYDNGKQIMNLLRNLNSEGVTVVMVTHDRELAAMADRHICIVDGAIVNYDKKCDDLQL